MLYLKSVGIDRFKSFRHAELLLSKGFTCVVGPNGSGKSNICDALLFGLGETALHRMRVSKLDELLSVGTKRKGPDVAKAHVRMEFAGDENLVVVRTVRSDGKTAYQLNGRHMTRQEVMEVLGRHGIRADETNTIAQGEINRIIDLTPKERRELIDIAAGIKEFEHKKAETMKELDTVSQRIGETKIMLNERIGFIRELEKEKEAAESYIKMNDRLRLLRYSVLASRKASLADSLDEYTKKMAIVDSKKNALAAKIADLGSRMAEFNSERQALTKELGSHTANAGEMNARLEAASKEYATTEAELSGGRNAIDEFGKFVADSNVELDRLGATMLSDKDIVEETTKGIVELTKQVGGETAAQVETDNSEKDIAALNATIQRLEAEFSQVQASISQANTEVASLVPQCEEYKRELERYTEMLKEKMGDVQRKRQGMAEVNSSAGGCGADIRTNEAQLHRMGRELESINSKVLSLREQWAVTQSREGGLLDKIGSRFGEKDGFYGKASQLCKYDERFLYAVEAAAGSRFEYFVVDSVDTANKIITYLKSNNLGRATFIPIKEVNVAEEFAKERGISPVIDVIDFEPRFRRVFQYIFNNSYIVKDIAQAKSYGVGKHRYATLSGDLVEQSGIVSGGSVKKRISLGFLENQIKSLEEQRDALKKGTETLQARIFSARKEQASLEMRARGYESEITESEAVAGKYAASIKEITAKLSDAEGRAAGANKRLDGLLARREQVESGLKDAKERLRAAYNKAIESSKEVARHGMSKAEKERIERIRAQLDVLKVRNAEARTEYQLLEKRKKELDAQISQRKELNRKTVSAVKEMERKLAQLAKQKSEIEKEMSRSSESNKKAYERLNAIDVELSKLGQENGALGVQQSNIERDLNELKMSRSQTEVRLNDIVAELAAYGQDAEPIKESLESMEKEVVVLGSKLAELGNVNLKAPELYEERKKSVDEAESRANTLEVEKQAILRMIDEIDSKKLQIFMNTFNDVNKNFSKLFNYVFEGKASIELNAPTDPFNSGLEIRIKNEKGEKVLNSMSGGQKSLISLMLLLAIHLCKPSALYVFDEVDSALDKENSKKLSLLIKQMSSDAQFIVVSHNDSLIVNADTAIGVVMTNEESKALGLEVASMVKGQLIASQGSGATGQVDAGSGIAPQKVQASSEASAVASSNERASQISRRGRGSNK